MDQFLSPEDPYRHFCGISHIDILAIVTYKMPSFALDEQSQFNGLSKKGNAL
jgi:hypothetical protein